MGQKYVGLDSDGTAEWNTGGSVRLAHPRSAALRSLDTRLPEMVGETRPLPFRKKQWAVFSLRMGQEQRNICCYSTGGGVTLVPPPFVGMAGSRYAHARGLSIDRQDFGMV